MQCKKKIFFYLRKKKKDFSFSGAVPSPFDCYLVNRGLKTLAVRMRQHMTSALRIANYLEHHKYVERVIYPGLESHPQHDLYKQQMSGFSGMISVYLKGDEVEKSQRFLKHLKVSLKIFIKIKLRKIFFL
jgi:cystathionine gamma-lyase